MTRFGGGLCLINTIALFVKIQKYVLVITYSYATTNGGAIYFSNTLYTVTI